MDKLVLTITTEKREDYYAAKSDLYCLTGYGDTATFAISKVLKMVSGKMARLEKLGVSQ